MKKIFLLVSTCVVLSGNAQDAALIVGPAVPETLDEVLPEQWQKVFGDYLEQRGNDRGVRMLFGSTSYAMIDCRSDWLTYREGQWSNQYVENNHGFTCSSSLFIDKGVPTLFGGYGYWRGQSLHVKFNESGEWEYLTSASVPNNYMSGLGFHYMGDDVVLLPGKIVDGARELRTPAEHGYHISRTTNEWLPVEVLVNKQKFEGFNMDYELITDEYRLSIGRGGRGKRFLIQDTQSQVIYSLDREYTSKRNEACYLEGDTLYIINPMHTIRFHIPSMIAEAAPLKIVPTTLSTTAGTNLIWWGSAGLLVAGSLICWGYRKKSVVPGAPAYYQEMLGYSGRSFTADQLNELFGLDHLSYDMIRKRRSVIVQSINAHHSELAGKKLINRVKDPSDKRHVIYQIKA